MIISPNRNYVFVHIPKTGGTSLATALEARAMRDDILIGDTPKARRRRGRLKGLGAPGRLWKHATLDDIAGVMPPEWMAQALVFTLVRNPWDRMVSYYHWLRLQRFDHSAVRAAQTHEFSAFLDLPDMQASIRSHPYGRYVRRGQSERTPLFIRLETFEADAAPLWDHLGFRLNLPHLNVSPRVRDYRQYYDDAARRCVASLCAEDIERFGYQFAAGASEG
ncbi:sulfotransferase family 2 domain-containing protein [Roseovarius sp. S1116L3]|uniref:sulfotransferase family 2 domain-containing protein n=1 Tax=Roseovarius roseus TaxID=3342636 RepID=UPI00372A7CC1